MIKDLLPSSLRGALLLHTPLFNKGTAFTQQERDALGLNGLLPYHISSVDEQLKRCYTNFSKEGSPLEKYVFLMNLLHQNELLFYQFLARYTEEMIPYIYTPTVGEAALQFHLVYAEQRGAYFSYPFRDNMEELVDNLPYDDVQIIVVTDGERILGLGDQGIGGMAIPIGKLILYTLIGGIHPAKVLPVMLDVGTNRRELLDNELYLGWRHPRIEGEEYDRFIERFVRAIQKRYPKVLLQWEDFGRKNARRLLRNYRKEILSFNDDIQGTAGAVLAALLSALKATGQKWGDQRIVIFGGGSAGIGVAELLLQSYLAQGFSQEEAQKKLYVLDRSGLIHFNTPNLDETARLFAHSREHLKDWSVQNWQHISLVDVVKNVSPTILIGVSAQAGVFTKEIIQEMASRVKQPIVFPLSNPTSKAECTPQELMEWTSGRAICATGTPFPPVIYKGKTYKIAQCNNVYIFPGLGLGALAAQAAEITDGMIFEAAQALAAHSPALQDPTFPLFPPLEKATEVSRYVAIAVAKRAIRDEVSPLSEEEVERRIHEMRWTPSYPSYV